jgi:eukaryotic-like serine/threonine-protein kinase
MRPDQWETLSAWFNAWLTAAPAAREELRDRLAAEHPDLVGDAERLVSAGNGIAGFLNTPALVLSVRACAEEEPLLPAGTMVGPYRLVGLLARGGMGDVYRATDVRLGRDVAVKMLAQTRTSDPRRVERFAHEARVTASLDHPNIVCVYDVGRAGDRAYLVAELLEGETLRACVDRGPMPVPEVLRIGREIARGLACAHRAGLVHRDLKPENVFLTNAGTTKLLDFGIAKLTENDALRDGLATRTGIVLGTAGYLAPEQIRGDTIDARADLFALGAVLFEMLAGTRAFAREHVVDTLHAILHDDPPDLLEVCDDVPPALAALVVRLLQKAPQGRMQSASDAIAVLEDVDVAASAATRPPAPHASTGLARRAAAAARATRVRFGWQLTAALAIVAALAATLVYRGDGSGSGSGTATMTLAVVPFRSMPDAPDGDLLELGLADVFISRLGQLAALRVLPLSATQRIRAEPDPSAAAGALGATHLLTGTLQRDGSFVRATVQLVSTSGAGTIWATPVDTDAASVFSIQDIIVMRVIEELAPQLPAGERRRLAQAGTRNGAAYDAYLRGRAYVLRPTLPELTVAVRHLKEAVTLDPSFADAWGSLGSAYRRMPLFDAEPRATFATARAAATRAMVLEATQAEAHAVLGAIAFWHDWDYPRAETLLRRALDLQPSSADFSVALAHLLSNIGRHEEALIEVRRGRALDPMWPAARALEGQFLFNARRYADALARLDEVVALAPRFPAGRTMRAYPLIALHRYDEAIQECEQVFDLHAALGAPRRHSFAVALRGYALARTGRRAEAELALAELRDKARDGYAPPHHEALLLHALGRDDEALGQLGAAVDSRDLFVTFAGVDPKWDALRATSAFQDVLRRVNLLEVSEPARP